ncbi:DNA-binding response regulator [Aestuariivirga litoralis]|uniref:DNA-binding response regulator n=1 Tax=Aestuariivirga litoralis TaxID=2650924 RepID=A0A2W2ATL2_9HYPH|nr:response regulator transcription factor [Aestuariivirga litoralis]PZF75880.1 DNA-binding response regulator [Aestuariivirga litoralis]
MRILLVEDTVDVGEAVAARLQRMGHAVDWQRTGPDAEAALEVQAYDLVVLDVMLPGKDGIAVLGGLRARGATTPVLMLTARSRIDDRVSALDYGADDYLTKPFDFREFEARVRALLRRGGGAAVSLLRLGDVEFDQAARSVTVAGRPCELTRRELALLEVFMLRPRKLFTKAELMEQLFGFDQEPGENAIELYVGRLRRKLGPARLEIRTLRGMGYQAVEHEG